MNIDQLHSLNAVGKKKFQFQIQIFFKNKIL